jgi:hypothetical protein
MIDIFPTDSPPQFDKDDNLSHCLIPSFQVVDSCLGPKNRRVVGGDINARLSDCRVCLNGTPLLLVTCCCFVYYLLRAIPYQFPDTDCPFQIVNESYVSYEFFGHAGKSSRIRRQAECAGLYIYQLLATQSRLDPK